MRAPNISHMVHKVPSFSKVSQIKFVITPRFSGICFLSHKEYLFLKKYILLFIFMYGSNIIFQSIVSALSSFLLGSCLL